MLKLLLSLVSGPLTAISSDLKEAYITKEKAQTDKEKLDADERVSILEARKTSILAAQSDPLERFVRIGLAFPFVVYINKLVLWDKVLSYWTNSSTDNLSPDLKQIMMIILGGYFIDTAVKRITRR
jgi:hypothetical protein